MTPEQKKFYNSKEWRYLRKQALIRDLYTCTIAGCGRPASVCDHIVSRRQGGKDELCNLRCLCPHHDREIKELEDGRRRGKIEAGKATVKGCFADGSPRDPAHPWYRGPPGASG